MARSSAGQPSFLGGEWSVSAQGRTDLPAYPTAMNACRNSYPTEEGAWTRRPGFLELGATYLGSPFSVNVEFALATGPQVYLEETWVANVVYLRFWTYLGGIFSPATYGVGPLSLLPDYIETITSISTASPALLTTGHTTTWATGDVVQIYPDQGLSTGNAPTLVGRQLLLTKVTTSTFTLTDMVTGANIDGSTLNFSAAGSYVAHILTIATSYTSKNDLTGSAALTGVRIVQTGQEAFFLSAAYKPYILSLGGPIATAGPTIPFTFTFADALFTSTSINVWDGPYADPLAGGSQTLNSLGSVANVSGDTWTFTITDGAYNFLAADVGRQIRLWQQPQPWSSGTSYTINQSVTYQGTFFAMGASGVGAGLAPNQALVVDGVSTFPWVLAPQAGSWSAGVITAKDSSSEVNVTLNLGAGQLVGGVIDTWQLGLYTANGTQWPSCGTYHEGRLWLGGLFPGRFDAGYANLLLSFQPTDYYGEVTDANAIGYTLNTPPQSNLIWMMTDSAGVICGTGGDEWLISAPETTGAISPSNIQGRRISRYGSAAVDPVRVGIAIIFVQAQQRQLIEYITDPFAQRYVGWRLNTLAKHLTADAQTPRAIIGITYQEEPTPILWVTRADSTLIGCTYRRQSTFGSEPPFFMGWHRHDYGYAPEDPGVGRTVMGGNGSGVSIGENGGGGGGIVVTTVNPVTSTGYVEMMGPPYSEPQVNVDIGGVAPNNLPVPINVDGSTANSISGVSAVSGSAAHSAGLTQTHPLVPSADLSPTSFAPISNVLSLTGSAVSGAPVFSATGTAITVLQDTVVFVELQIGFSIASDCPNDGSTATLAGGLNVGGEIVTVGLNSGGVPTPVGPVVLTFSGNTTSLGGPFNFYVNVTAGTTIFPVYSVVYTGDFKAVLQGVSVSVTGG